MILGYLLLKKRRRKRREKTLNILRKVWVSEIFKHRKQRGVYHTLVQEVLFGDRESYFKLQFYIIC